MFIFNFLNILQLNIVLILFKIHVGLISTSHTICRHLFPAPNSFTLRITEAEQCFSYSCIFIDVFPGVFEYVFPSKGV